MNERIRDLAEQARRYAEEQYPGSFVKYDPKWFEFYNKKFAELIVQDCVKLNSELLSFAAFLALYEKYQQHFGVE